jgi:predicted SnoaL-like aldol condensation-catalyzing enzyme
VAYFTQVRKATPKPIPDKMKTAIVAVTAEGDVVVVSYPKVMQDPKDPSKTYTTTWFDMWRFKDGKADEHWDGAVKP